MIHKLFQTAFLLIVAILVAFPVHATEKVTIAQFGKERFLLYLPLYVAMEEGIFEKNGIEVELKFAGNDDQIFAAVASGDADFGVGDPVFTAIAQEKGFPAKTVALMITNLGISGYTNNPEIPVIQKPTDLKDLRVGSFPEPSTTYTLLSELKRKHPKDLFNTKIIEAPFGAQVALIEAGQADIAVDIEPTVSIVEDRGYRVVFSMKDFVEQQAITGLMVVQEMIDKKPDTVQRVVKSLQEAIDKIFETDGIEVGVRVGKKIYPDLKESIIRTAVTRMMRDAMYPQSVVVRDDYWQRTLKTRLDSGDLKEMQPTEMAVDNSFALKAAEQ